MYVCMDILDTFEYAQHLVSLQTAPECGGLPCYPPYWQCKTGDCISSSFRCDHRNDCDDNSDEENCHYEPCANETFK